MSLSFKTLIKSLSLSCLLLSSCGTVIEWKTLEHDQFNGNVTRKTGNYIIASATLDDEDYDYIALSFTVINGNNYLLTLTTYGSTKTHNSYTRKKGNNVYLKLKDDSLLTFTNSKDVCSTDDFVTIGPYTLEYWEAQTVCSISHSDLIKLENSDFTAARVETDNGNIDYSMNAGQNKRLKQVVSLVLNAGR